MVHLPFPEHGLAKMNGHELLDYVAALAHAAPVREKIKKPPRPLSPQYRDVLEAARLHLESGPYVDRIQIANDLSLPVKKISSILSYLSKKGHIELGVYRPVSTILFPDRDERHPLYRNNQALVRHVIREVLQFKRPGSTLFSAGKEGLLHAVRRFDESRGNEFSTYAVPVIAGFVLRAARVDAPRDVPRAVVEPIADLDDISEDARERAAEALDRILELHRGGIIDERHLLVFLLRNAEKLKLAQTAHVLGLKVGEEAIRKTELKAKSILRTHLR